MTTPPTPYWVQPLPEGAKVQNEIALKVFNKTTGEFETIYEPETHPRCNQLAFHTSDAPNLLALGTRGTGKSKVLRWDAILRCLAFPNFRALILRRKIPELRTSHLAFIDQEMFNLGGEKNGFVYLSTVMEAKFPNGSVLKFSHCEKLADVMNYLSSASGGSSALTSFDLPAGDVPAHFGSRPCQSRTRPTRPWSAPVATPLVSGRRG
jgi:hypothetical protein